ncbi:hypothetical protein H9639_03450 [Arthrobacter sp. Sa2CUA1]|uniref:Uncharacterized protein n=1 Tax=Arthrobacter gallicola TaxID=2762225 RepID=A0ABR8UPR2_9MICC|nr:hypothetical protein [Arthrobacter gallicola]MBD7994350.1 hypothetical protein [Arthrobacter gallicola]
MTNGPESADAPRRSRRAAGSTADAGHQERESQQRARDRETLRAYKALTDNQPRPEESSANPPTRRQLRIAQQQAQQAAREKAGGEQQGRKPDTSVPPVSPPAGAASAARSEAEVPGKASGVQGPADSSGRRAGPAAASSNRSGDPAPQLSSRRERRRRAAEEQQAPVIKPVTPAPSRAPSVKAPVDAKAPVATKAPGDAKAPVDTKAPAGAPKAPANPKAHVDAKAPAQAAAPEPPAAPAQSPASGTAPARPAATEPNADIADMSVEQALAAREALKHQARNQVAAMEALQQADPHAVDLELLAQQRALAERAAVLNRRTQNIQRLAQENEQRRSPQSDPTTAHNLAMVTPLEFVEVPGLERPVMKPPATSHVPVVTSSNPAAPSKPAAPSAAGAGRKASTRQPSRGNRPAAAQARSQEPADVRHSRILARADALVNAPLEADQGAKPIGARSAFGLDPLDVMTAGLRRSRRIRAVSLGMAGVGLTALILGIILIVGGLGS